MTAAAQITDQHVGEKEFLQELNVMVLKTIVQMGKKDILHAALVFGLDERLVERLIELDQSSIRRIAKKAPCLITLKKAQIQSYWDNLADAAQGDSLMHHMGVEILGLSSFSIENSNVHD